MVATIDATNTQIKTISVNGVLRGTQTGTGTIEYGTARGLALGSLFDDGLAQALVGNMAEVLIYSDVSAAQDGAVQQYLASKYFRLTSASPTLNIQNLGGGTNSVTWNAPGFKLQQATSLAGPWSEVVGATSPYNVPASGSGTFYRLWQF